MFGPAARIALFAALFAAESRSDFVNNVCKTFADYKSIQSSEHCWFNPDVDDKPPGIIQRRGYPFESYNLTTDDGYELTLYRIPHDNTDIDKKRTPIFLQHGIGVTSAFWVLVGKRSVAYHLVDSGYDVWIGNSRGSPLSGGHVKYSTRDREYWDFSFHEIGDHDIPTFLNFVQEKTNTKSEIIYVGHSMGTSAGLIYMILHPEEAEENLSGAVLLAPVAYMTNLRHPDILVAPYWRPLLGLANKMQIHGLNQNSTVTKQNMQNCLRYPLIKACVSGMFLGMGFNFEQLQPEDVPMIFNHAPAGASVKSYAHFAQVVANKGTFQYFDYGKEKNLMLYNSTKPPPYDVSKITLPVHLIYGKKDVIADEQDVTILYEKLPGEKSMAQVSTDGKHPFNHGDFVYAKDIETLFYPTLDEKIALLDKNRRT